jgi:hypothetical protein
MRIVKYSRYSRSANIRSSFRYSINGSMASHLTAKTTKRATERTSAKYTAQTGVDKKIGNVDVEYSISSS